MAIETTPRHMMRNTHSGSRPAWTREPLSEKQQAWMDSLVAKNSVAARTLAELTVDSVMLAPGDHSKATREEMAQSTRNVLADTLRTLQEAKDTRRGEFGDVKDRLTTELATRERLIPQLRELVGAHLSRIAGREITGQSVPAAPQDAAAEDGATYRAPDGRVFHAYTGQQSGRLLLKLWDGEEFAYFGAAVKLPAGSVKLSTEEMQEFGRATGTCAICMRHLTDDESVRRGIGPVCWSKL